MLLVDHEIREWCRKHKMLEPFSEGVQEGSVISYGLTSAGYDLRLGGNKVLIFKNSFNEIISPKRMKEDPAYMNRIFDTISNLSDHDAVIIPPHGYILAYTLEYIRIPVLLKGRCVGKSTLARCAVITNLTPLEPEWEGHLTLEVANISCCPVEVYVGEGIAQLEFEILNSCPEKTYRDKKGKYLNQGPVPVPARVIS